MPPAALLEQIGRTKIDKERLAQRVFHNPRLLPELLRGLGAGQAAVRFGCAGALRVLSERQPVLLYPHWERLVALIESPNAILQWTAFRAIANLAGADSDDRIEGLLDRYLAPIRGQVMITAATVIAGGARIARAKPHLADRIAQEILQVQRARYKTAECRNVAIGHAIEAFDVFFDLIGDAQPVLRFVRRQLRNTRNAVRKKADSFLKKHASAPAPRARAPHKFRRP
jgi:hypothetical protein